METKELSEIVTVALEGIIQDRIKKYVAENQREIAKTFLEVDDEKLQKIIDSKDSPASESLSVERVKKFIADWEENDEVMKDITSDYAKKTIARLWLEENSDEVKELLSDSTIEDIASTWIEDNPSEAGDKLNDNIYDSDARDLVTSLIERHW